MNKNIIDGGLEAWENGCQWRTNKGRGSLSSAEDVKVKSQCLCPLPVSVFSFSDAECLDLDRGDQQHHFHWSLHQKWFHVTSQTFLPSLQHPPHTHTPQNGHGKIIVFLLLPSPLCWVRNNQPTSSRLIHQWHWIYPLDCLAAHFFWWLSCQ